MSWIGCIFTVPSSPARHTHGSRLTENSPHSLGSGFEPGLPSAPRPRGEMEPSEVHEMSVSYRWLLWFGAIVMGPVALAVVLAGTTRAILSGFPAALLVGVPAAALVVLISRTSLQMMSRTAGKVTVHREGLEIAPLLGRTTHISWREVRQVEGFAVSLREGLIRGLRMLVDGEQPFVLTSRVHGFDELLTTILERVGERRGIWRPSLWERVMFATYTRRGAKKRSDRFWAQLSP